MFFAVLLAFDHFRCVRNISKNDYYNRYVCQSVRPSARNNSVPIGGIFMKIDI